MSKKGRGKAFQAERESWDLSRSKTTRLEYSQSITWAQIMLVFGVRDEQGRCGVAVMEASGQDQGSPRTGRNRTDQGNAKTGLLCPEKEWSEADQSQSQ